MSDRRRTLSPQRRKVVLIFSLSAVFAGSTSILVAQHPRAAGIVLGIVIVMLLYGIFEFAQLKREEKR